MLTSAMVWRWIRRLSLELAVDASSTADDRAVRIQNRRARARQRQIVAAEMFLPMNGHGAAFREAGADAVGAFVAFVPQGAQRQTGFAELALQGRIGDGGQHDALRVRQDDRESRPCNLFVQALHFGARHRQQFAHALLQFLERLRIENGTLPRRRWFDAVFAQASIPGTRDMRLDARWLQSVLDDVKNPRRMARCDTQVRHDIPRLIACPCLADLTCCKKPTEMRSHAQAQPPGKAWPLCAVGAICSATYYDCGSGGGGGAPNLYAGSPLYLERTNARIFHRSSELLMMVPKGGMGPTTFSRPLRV